MHMETVKLEVYGPFEIMDTLRNELSNIGACCVGNYTHVTSYHEVSGTYKPEALAQPYLGTIGSFE